MTNFSAVTNLIMEHPLLFIVAVIIAVISYIRAIYVALSKFKK